MGQASLLWVDLEMTGLDPKVDKILEVAVIATDWDFREIAKLELIQQVDSEFMKQQMVGEFWEINSQARDALFKQNNHGQSAESIEAELLKFANQHFKTDQPILLAGNSIHQDRKFIENEWPKLNHRLHYRMLDVSAWKVVFDGKYGKKFAKPETHRALEDIKGSIMELKYYMKKVKV